jgi:hypothetical protein
MRNTDDDEEVTEHMDDDDNNLHLANDEEYAHLICPSSNRFDRLNANEIAYARSIRLKEIQMWSIIREALTYFGFVIVLYLITYSNRDQNAFLQVNHLRKIFLKTNPDYTKVRYFAILFFLLF